MSKEEALDFARTAIEKIYEDDTIPKKLSEIHIEYTCGWEDEKYIKKTDWGDMLFIYDFIELYGNERRQLSEAIIDELRSEFERIGFDIDPKKELGIGRHSLSSVRNWLNRIRQSLESMRDYQSEESLPIFK
jgi:hypothetical protein